MSETKIDRETIGRLANALAFICKPDDPAVVAMKQAAQTGTDKDIKAAYALFLKVNPSHRAAALNMIADF